MPKNCDACKHTDTKSTRYPCSECHYLLLDKWEAPRLQEWLSVALLYKLAKQARIFKRFFEKHNKEIVDLIMKDNLK